MATGVEPHVVQWDREVFRVARREVPVAYSRIEAHESSIDAGNRFDVRGGGVLYTGGSQESCFVETMSRLRTSERVRKVVGCDDHFMNPNTVPASWRNDRCIVGIRPKGGVATFIDLDHPDTIAYLDRKLRSQLQLLGVDQLDRGFLYSSNRIVTRTISEWAYTVMDTDDEYLLYGGIKYESRLSKDLTCWAIYEGLPIETGDPSPIERDNEALMKVASRFGLTIM